MRSKSNSSRSDSPPEFFELHRELLSISTSNRHSSGSISSNHSSYSSYSDHIEPTPPFEFCNQHDADYNKIPMLKVKLTSETNEIEFLANAQKMNYIDTYFDEIPNHNKNIFKALT